MDINRMRSPALALIFAGMLVSGSITVPSWSAQCERDQIARKVKAVIRTEVDSFQPNDKIVVKILVTNDSDCTLYLVKESWSGGVWIDKSSQRIVVAHYAVTWERENELRGGWTSGEIYRPEFYELQPGRQATLEWSLGEHHHRGSWRLEGKISVLTGISQFAGLEGTAAAEAIAKTDVVIPCLGKTIVIDGTASER